MGLSNKLRPAWPRRLSWPKADPGVRPSRVFQGPGDEAAPQPTSPELPDLSVPAADRPIGGGEATEETRAEEAAEGPAAGEPTPLMMLLGLEDSPIKVYGWIQNSFTGNAKGFGNRINFGVGTNWKANQWMGNQYYLILENPVDQSDEVNFGFRVDSPLGHDWQFNFMQGLLNRAFINGRFAGYDPAQFYAEVHLPDLTGLTKGMDIKGGRWFTIHGDEQVPAIARPLLSNPYMFNYCQPFTHFGAMRTWHLTDKVNLYNGVINNWDRWVNENYAWGYMGGLTWTGNEDRTTVASPEGREVLERPVSSLGAAKSRPPSDSSRPACLIQSMKGEGDQEWTGLATFAPPPIQPLGDGTLRMRETFPGTLIFRAILGPCLLVNIAAGQQASPALRPSPASRPDWPGRLAPQRDSALRRVVRLQDTPAAPGAVDLPPLPSPSPPGGAPSVLDVPESARVGEPTIATAEEFGSPPEAEITGPTPLLLMRALGLRDSRVRVFGWLQNSFTGNTNGTPRDGINFGVFPNTLANTWMGNQYYFVAEDPLELTDRVNFGGRVDFLFGHDWQFTKMYGLFDRAFEPYSFPGVDVPQFYAEVHLPVLTPGGLDIKGGRFANPGGYESFMAINRPLLSVPYMYNFTPFTFFGMLATWHVTDRVNLYSGTVNGMDRWINSNYIWNYFGGVTLKSSDDKTTLNFYGLTGPNQLPRFAPADYPLLPVASPPPGFRARQVNPLYAESYRAYLSLTLVRDWTEKLTEVLETEVVWDPRSLGFGPGPRTLYYQGLGHWFLYKVTGKATAVWRAEMFWDPNGAATGIKNTYFETTLGVQYRPRDWLWVRPEVRYDNASTNPAYDDQTRWGQLTLGLDVIFLW